MSQYIKSAAKFVSLFIGAALMWGCTDEVKNSENTSISDDDIFTFQLSQEGSSLGTRSESGISSVISTGSLVNRLYYAIYSKDSEEDEYTLDSFYHPSPEKYKVIENYGDSEKERLTLKLIADASASDSRKYKILAWAQYVDEEGNSPYYTFTGNNDGEISSIQVSYTKGQNGETNFPNNDEYRDAFYASKEFTLAGLGQTTEVKLTRPFSQINVGTSGWDVEGLAKVEPDRLVVKYSKITIKNVATSFNMLKNEVSSDDDNLTDVVFDFSTIPAYMHLNEKEGIDFDGLNSEQLTGIKDKDHNENGIFPKEDVDEEFLLIGFPDKEKPKDPNSDNLAGSDSEGYVDYIGWDEYDHFCATSASRDELLYDIYTETFKYLSMSYVLVPFTMSYDETEGKEIPTRSTVEVDFDCSAKYADGSYPGLYSDGINVISLKNVPVCSNYRTNIIAAGGTGFFMNSNEINVAIISDTFADYYRRLGATDKDWNDEGPKDDPDRNGEDINGDFHWSDEDIDPEAGKMALLMPGLTDLSVNFNGNSKSGDIVNNVIDVYYYSDDSVTITFNPKEGYEKGSFIEGMFPNPSYDYYIGSIKITDDNRVQKNNSTGRWSITIPMSELEEAKKRVNPVVTILDELETYFEEDESNKSVTSEFEEGSTDKLKTVKNENVPALRYYPIPFRIKPAFTDETNHFNLKDLEVTINLHTSYKFTFSSTSTDEGGEVWNDLINKGSTATTESTSGNGIVSRNETGSKYIDKKTVAISNLGRISATSRIGTDGSGGGNHRLFAIKDANIGDHFKFKGNAFVNGDGHYITLHKIRKNCAITVKMGRDYGQDNSSARTAGSQNNRALYVDWSGNPYAQAKLAENWFGYDPSIKENENKFYYTNNSNNTSRHQYDETKILSSPTTTIEDFSQPKDILLYSLETGYCVYWVIVSEKNDNTNWLN